MISSLLIGALCGARSMTPLAAVSLAAATRALPRDNGAPRVLSRPWACAGAVAMAAGEIAGDKWRHAPDRTVAPGLLARIIAGALSGMAVAPGRTRHLGAAAGAAAAVATSFPSLAARKRAMRHYGQVRSGFVEDALVAACAVAIIMSLRR